MEFHRFCKSSIIFCTARVYFLQLEEAKQNLEDYERVSKIQRNLTVENSELEQELSALQARLEQAEKARRSEITDTKMRYDGQMNTMRDELKSLQNQVI